MANIIRGTTPTIMYTFDKVAISDLTDAIFTIKMGNAIKIEKDMTEAVAGTKTLSWTLTQEECLTLSGMTVSLMCNWLTAAGLRGASDEVVVNIRGNHIEEVIT